MGRFFCLRAMQKLCHRVILVNHYRFARHSYLHHKRPYQQQKNTPEA